MDNAENRKIILPEAPEVKMMSDRTAEGTEGMQVSKSVSIAAKIIRVLTIPPLLVTALLTVLFFLNESMFRSVGDILAAVGFLAVIPTLAYPLQPVIPGFRGRGRKGQRSLAMILSAVGYVGGVIFAYVSGASGGLKFIFNAYLLSVILLLIFNKLLKLRASGHACGVFGPLLFAVYFLGSLWIVPCLIVSAAVIWSSVKLGRHTPKELLLGGLCALFAFCVCLLII